MSNQQQPTSIEKIGLKTYLDDTKHLHRDQDYDRFVFYITPALGLGNAAIGRIMNVTRKTISRWVEIHKKEQRNAK